MKYAVLIFINVLLFRILSFSQKNEKEIYFSFDTSGWPNSPQEKKRIEVEGKILKVIKKDSLQKIISEFIRIDDNSYYFIQTDSSGGVLSEGKASVEKKAFRTIKFPIYNSNGNIESFIKQGYHKLIRNGNWSETISDSTSKHGFYLNNKKEGSWMYIIMLGKGKGIEEKKEVYKEDKLISTQKINLLEISSEMAKKAIIGKWALLYNADNVPYLDSIVYFNKISDDQKSGFRSSLEFKPDGKCIMATRGEHSTPNFKCSWSIDNKNKIIIISFPGVKSKILISYVTRKTLQGVFTESQ
jgi:hypothetical protein